MLYRTLGRTGLEVSCIGFGALPLAGLSQDEADRVLNRALDRGMNFIDTARGYRESEKLIGNAVSERRGEYLLTTKTRVRREKGIREELATSLANLKTDHLELYQVHYVNTGDELDDVLGRNGALEVMQKLRQEGVCDFIGITGHDAAVLLEAAKTGAFDTVQGAFSYIEREQKILDLIDYCARENIGFIVQKPLAGGAIVPAAGGLKWILSHPVSTVIPGMVTVEQVEENGRVGSVVPAGPEGRAAPSEFGDYSPSEEELKELDRLAEGLGDRFCRRCNYCHAACPENIRIGVILEFFGKAKIPDNFALSQRWYRGFEINGSNCTECGLCLGECPYGLPIPDMLSEAHALLG
jgi:predicted aldo/keto reductase-like oxidoreductase